MAVGRLAEIPTQSAASGMAEETSTEQAARVSAINFPQRSEGSEGTLFRPAHGAAVQFRDRTQRLASELHIRTRYMVENYPLYVVAAVAGAAFSLGLLLKLARSNRHE